jgi:hypothetical protein
MVEPLLLGAGGTLQATFTAIRDAKRQVSISLIGGEPTVGSIAGEPSTSYVVLRQELKNTTSTEDVLIQYTAIATVRVVLNTGRIAGTGLAEDKLQSLKGRVLLVTLAPRGQGQEIIKGRLQNLEHKAIELVGDERTADLAESPDDLAPQRSGVVLTRLQPGDSPRRLLLADVQEVVWQQS